MKTWIFWATATSLLAAIVHLSLVLFVPMLDIGARMAQFETTSEINTLKKLSSANDKNTMLIEPSPDISYAFCRFDLSSKPVQVSAPIPDSYWSVSVYSDTGENIYTINDTQTGVRNLKLLIVNADSQDSVSNNALVKDAITFASPALTGLIIFRGFVPDRSRRAEVDNIVAAARCQSL